MPHAMWRYLSAAFNLRAPGLPVPPNWLFLAGIAVLGGALAQPGIWLLGAGLELAYLWFAAQHPRLRAAVDAAEPPAASTVDWAQQRAALLAALTPADRQVHTRLEERCREITDRLASGGDPLADTHAAAVNRAAQMHLRLLTARIGVRRLVEEACDDDVSGRIAQLTQRRDAADGELRTSIEGQLAILEQRRAHQLRAQQRLQLLDADLERLRQQVELAREQALLAGGGDGLGRSLDLLGAELGDTGRWAFDSTLAADPLAATPAIRPRARETA